MLARGSTSGALAAGCLPSGWERVPVPMVGSGGDVFNAVAATSPTDAWAVGASLAAGSSRWQPMAMHWDGSTWTVASLPATGYQVGTLAGVLSAGPGDVWAVGTEYNDHPSSGKRWLVMHLDDAGWHVFGALSGQPGEWYGIAEPGTPTIRIAGYSRGGQPIPAVASIDPSTEASSWTNAPGAGAFRNGFTDVAGDLAVGMPYNWSTKTPLIDHWNGTAWARQSVPYQAAGGGAPLDAIDARYNGVAFAVGGADGSPLVLRWDGSSWKPVDASALTAGLPSQEQVARLLDVHTAYPPDVYVVGDWWDGTSYGYHPLIGHWDGHAWERMDVPVPAHAVGAVLSGIGPKGAPMGPVLAVGYLWKTGGVARAYALRPCTPT